MIKKNLIYSIDDNSMTCSKDMRIFIWVCSHNNYFSVPSFYGTLSTMYTLFIFFISLALDVMPAQCLC